MKTFEVECIEKPTGKGQLGEYMMPFEVGKTYTVIDTDYSIVGSDNIEYYLFKDVEIEGVLMPFINSKYFKK